MDTRTENEADETEVISVRYWASARSAAGLDGESVPADAAPTLARLRQVLAQRHPGSRLTEVLDTCSVLVGDRPANTEDPDDVLLAPGATVEFLPPFAGG